MNREEAKQLLPKPLASSGAYKSWQSMKIRCDHKGYKTSDGKPLTVCRRWRAFSAFYHDMGERPTGHSIDRIDGNVGYKPGNCRWATAAQQARNRLSKKLSEKSAIAMAIDVLRGMTEVDAARKYKTSTATVSCVLRQKTWPEIMDKALLIMANGDKTSLMELAYSIGYADASTRGGGFRKRISIVRKLAQRVAP